MNDELIAQQFSSLPPDIQAALTRLPWKERLAEIAKKERFDEVTAAALETETMLILYGFLSADHYIENIQRELVVDEEVAERVGNEVATEVFAALQEELDHPPAPEEKVGPQIPELAPKNLPMIESGEVAHDVPHVETPMPEAKPIVPAKVQVATPDFRYQAGKDPYREPLQ